MSRYSYGYPKYISVGERQAKAARKIEQLKKKNPNISPVEIQGTKLAHSWWGISWNKNLEGYADYSNRIGRGKSYVRHGAVLDLKIEQGKILSLVQGSSAYKVKITIDKLKPTVWAAIVNECRGKIDSLGDLVDGKLPRAMESLLTDSKNGIFPSPSEIKFDCSCPDSAYMCKHVAATLYGVGTRLDNDPSLFFTLRGVKMETLVSQTLKNEADTLLNRARSSSKATGGSKNSKRIIKNADLSSAFGIEMEDETENVPPPKTKAVPAKKRVSKLKPKSNKTKAAIGKAAAKKVPSLKNDKIIVQGKNDQTAPGTKDPDYETVVKIIRRRRVKGIGFKEIKERTAINDTKIRNILYRARQNNEIENISRGLYIKKN